VGPSPGADGSAVEEMVQVFMVVRCYSCKTFQVHQVSWFFVVAKKILFSTVI
jgi:hypothetical protein